MSNRATQGLQISLIVSVMLNVVLGVTTYLYNKQAFEKTNAAVAADDREQEAPVKMKTAEDKFDRRGRCWAIAKRTSTSSKSKYNDDQQLAGTAPKAAAEGEQKNVLGYSQMVAALVTTRNTLSNKLKDYSDKYNQQELRFRNREEASGAAVAAARRRPQSGRGTHSRH